MQALRLGKSYQRELTIAQLLQIKAISWQEHPYGQKPADWLTGGAMLGAVAFGEYDNLETAVAGMVRSGITYKPDRTAHELYAEYMNQYRRVLFCRQVGL